MRISQDDSSWRAGGIIRRDFRSDPQAGPDQPRGRSRRKDGIRWCRGVTGRDHRLEKYIAATYTYTRVDADGTSTEVINHRYDTRCARCHLPGRRLPDHVRAQLDERLATHLALAAAWCGDGHLYDDETEAGSWSRHVCVMCGHCRTGRRGRGVWDIPAGGLPALPRTPPRPERGASV